MDTMPSSMRPGEVNGVHSLFTHEMDRGSSGYVSAAHQQQHHHHVAHGPETQPFGDNTGTSVSLFSSRQKNCQHAVAHAIGDLEQTVEARERELAAAKEQIRQLQEDYQFNLALITERDDALTMAEASIRNTFCKYTALEQSLIAEQAAHSAAMEDVRELRVQVSESQTQLEEERKAAEKRVTELKEQLEEERSQQQQTTAAKLARLQAQHDAASVRMEASVREEAKAALERQEERRAEAEAQRLAAVEAQHAIQIEKEAAEAECVRLQKRVDLLDAAAKEAEERAQLEARRAAAPLRAAKASSEAAEVERARLQTAVDQQQNELEALREAMEAQRVTHQQQSRELVRAKAEATRWEDEEQRTAARGLEEVRRVEERLAASERCLERAKEELAALRREHSEWMEGAQEEAGKWRRELRTSEAARVTLEEQMSLLQSTNHSQLLVESLRAEKTQLMERIMQLERVNEEVRSQVAAFTLELQSDPALKQARENAVAVHELQGQLREAHQGMGALSEELRACHVEISQLKEQQPPPPAGVKQEEQREKDFLMERIAKLEAANRVLQSRVDAEHSERVRMMVTGNFHTSSATGHCSSSSGSLRSDAEQGTAAPLPSSSHHRYYHHPQEEYSTAPSSSSRHNGGGEAEVWRHHAMQLEQQLQEAVRQRDHAVSVAEGLRHEKVALQREMQRMVDLNALLKARWRQDQEHRATATSAAAAAAAATTRSGISSSFTASPLQRDEASYRAYGSDDVTTGARTEGLHHRFSTTAGSTSTAAISSLNKKKRREGSAAAAAAATAPHLHNPSSSSRAPLATGNEATHSVAVRNGYGAVRHYGLS